MSRGFRGSFGRKELTACKSLLSVPFAKRQPQWYGCQPQHLLPQISVGLSTTLYLFLALRITTMSTAYIIEIRISEP